ncbi:MAG: hypothetical protein HY016_03525 [Nitrosomonadales bacterium]|nr:hypothetical protein [Nitrosomonadales bacterium]
MTQADNDTQTATPAKRPGKIKWVVGGILLLIAAAAAMNLPRGYSDDLSRIGKGKAAVVLVHNKNSPESIGLMQVLDEVRGGYGGKIEFLLTEPNTPEGSAFMKANNAPQVSLALFNAHGDLIKILGFPQTAGNMQQEITSALGVTP